MKAEILRSTYQSPGFSSEVDIRKNMPNTEASRLRIQQSRASRGQRSIQGSVPSERGRSNTLRDALYAREFLF